MAIFVIRTARLNQCHGHGSSRRSDDLVELDNLTQRLMANYYLFVSLIVEHKPTTLHLFTLKDRATVIKSKTFTNVLGSDR